jgi:uncharacterized membrane protein YbhN (UPF0104 family)
MAAGAALPEAGRGIAGMTVRPWLRRLFTAALVAAAFGFLGWQIVHNAEQLRSFRWDVRPGLLLLSVFMLVAALFSGVAVWRMVIRRFGVEVPLRALARAWFLANLSRYVPGVVWQFLSLAQLGPSVGLTPSATITTLLAYMGLSFLSAGVVGAWLLPAELAGQFAPVLDGLRWISPLAVVLVHPAAIRSGIGLMARATRRTALDWKGSWLEGIWLLVLTALAWGLSGFAFYLFLASFVSLPLATLPAVVATNALAFAVGYLVVFAPGGLGFKEGAVALLLAGLVPPAVAASLAIASRLWTIAGEVVPALYLLPRPRVRATHDPGGPVS